MTKVKLTDEEKRIKKRTYMREWKRKRYAENPEGIKHTNKNAYYKLHYNATTGDIKEYGEHLPLVAKINSCLEELKTQNTEIFKSVIQKYTQDI